MELDLSKPSQPLFFSSEEKSLLFDMVAEAFDVSYKVRPLVQIDRRKQNVNEFFLEAPLKSWGKIIYIPYHIFWETPQYILTLFNLEVVQQTAVTFSAVHLKEAGIEDIEDLVGAVVFQDYGENFVGEEYIIDAISKKSEDVINTESDIPLVAATVSLLRSRAGEYSSELPYEVIMEGWKALDAPVFYDENGEALVQSINQEFYSFVFPEIPILTIDRDKTNASKFFGESVGRRWNKVKKIPGFVRWSPVVHNLGTAGFDAQQEVIVKFSVKDIETLGVSTHQDLVGAVLGLKLTPESDNFLYEVLIVKDDAYDPYDTFINIELVLDIYKTDEYLPIDPSDFGTSPIFFSKDEIDFQHGIYVEYLYTGYPSIPIVLVDADSVEAHPFFREQAAKKWTKPFYIPAQLQWEPPQFILEEWGIDVQQEVLVTTSSLILSQLPIETYRDLEGAIIVVDTDQSGIRKEFEVLGVHFQPQSAAALSGELLDIAISVKVRSAQSGVLDSGLPAGLSDDQGFYFFGKKGSV